MDDIIKTNGIARLNSKANGNTEVSALIVDKQFRKQGIGSAIMVEICNQADKEGVTLELSPTTEWGATSVGRLTRFYKQFGFVENRGNKKRWEITNTMYRESSST